MMRSNVSTEASFSTRVNQWWSGIPFVTSGIVIICTVIYFLCVLVGYDSFDQLCFWPSEVISRFQVYRIYTSVLFHGSFMHVLFNMLALVPIGSALERIMGSVRYLHVILVVATCNAALHLLIAFVAAHNLLHPFDSFMNECTIGFSGIIFSMIVMETGLSGNQVYSVFGFFNVAAKWYPWILLILFQLLMSNVSLIGHLCGILSGFAYTHGFFKYFLLGSSSYSAIESSAVLASCVRRPRFIVGGGNGVSTSGGSLPSFSTNPISGGTISNFWRNFNSWMPQRESSPETPQDPRFPGRGRTLGSHQSRPVAESELQTRLLERNIQAETPQRINSHEPISANSVSSVTNPSQQGVTNPEDQGHSQNINKASQLIAMGFEKEKAEAALIAANGDITLAVEFLSSQG